MLTYKPFLLRHPKTVAEAARELESLGENARIYAGGTELLFLMRHGLIRPQVLLNIKQIPGLENIVSTNSRVQIGACVTHRRLETDAIVCEQLPTLAHAERQVANIRVRIQGTIGGNLCFADPHSDPGTVLLIYEASVTLGKATGTREIPLREFFRGMYETKLEDAELLVHINVPKLPVGWESTYLRIHRLQRPTLGAAVAAKLSNFRVDDVRLAIGSIGPKPERLDDLESKIRGSLLGDATRMIIESEKYLEEILRPSDDFLGSRQYKLYITKVLLSRALSQIAGLETGKSNERTE